MAARPLFGFTAIVGIIVSSHIAIDVAQGSVLSPAQVSARLSSQSDKGYYTLEQAARGRALFNRHCAYCHAGDPLTAASAEKGRGFRTGPGRNYMSLASPYLQSKFAGKIVYPNVYFLFKRIESMPANDVTSITPQQRADIVAFILHANGQIPGLSELEPDYGVMRAMFLNEEGFEAVFNGRDFTGMKFLLGPDCRPAPEGCGKTEPGGVFSVKDGTLYCSCRIHGYWYPERAYLNFTLRFDYRFDVTWADDEDLFVGNSGTILFIMDHLIWPRGIEIDGAHRTNLRVNALGTRVKVTDYSDARTRARKPIGQWQSVEIVSKNGEIRSSLNGTLVSVVHEHEFKEPGYIGFQSQGVPLQWRNIRIKVE
jgi:mono/diheme cytochrome c family protein